MLVERPETKPKTKRRIIRAIFVMLVIVWLSVLSIAMVMIDDGHKKRIRHLENEIELLKQSR